ncbi:MAG: hypothetical protein ACXWTS_02125 [Methylococcaceae bacterium]
MGRLKRFSGLFIAFLGGIFVACLGWFIFLRQPYGRMSIQSQVIAPHISLPGSLDDTIQRQNNVGSASYLKNPIESSDVVERSGTGSKEDQPVYGAIIEPPTPGVVLNSPPAPEIIELPLESEAFEEAPKPETFENTTDNMAVSEELPEPGIVENASSPNYHANK